MVETLVTCKKLETPHSTENAVHRKTQANQYIPETVYQNDDGGKIGFQEILLPAD